MLLALFFFKQMQRYPLAIIDEWELAQGTKLPNSWDLRVWKSAVDDAILTLHVRASSAFTAMSAFQRQKRVENWSQSTPEMYFLIR